MWFHSLPPHRMVWVEWRPPQPHLHYPELYLSICEYLRVPPCPTKRSHAEAYLANLTAIPIPHYAPVYPLQRDRIAWTQAWLSALCLEDEGMRTKMLRVN